MYTLIIGAALFASMEGKSSGPEWMTNYDKALELAKTDKKLILADFTGSDWCGWCIKLREEVFDTPEFKKWADKYVLLEVDFPHEKEQDEALKAKNKELLEKFGVQGFPTIVFLNAKGEEVARTGYEAGGPKAWTESAQKKINAARPDKSEKTDKTDKTTGGEAGWVTSWEEAVKLSKDGGKPILADFTGSDWCGWCIKLKEEVFDTPEFKKWAGKNVVLLEVDFPHNKKQGDDVKKQNAELQKKYAIQGYPTILILNAKGDKLGELGYMPDGPKKWIEAAEKFTKKKG